MLTPFLFRCSSLIFAAILIGFNLEARAETTSVHGFLVTVEPIVAYEYTARNLPTFHRKGMLIYGARFTAGRPHVAAEGEYTRGNDTEAFTTSLVTTINTTRENIRIGVRGSYELLQMLSALSRVGAQATKWSASQADSNGTLSTTHQDWEIRPYAGAGLQLTPTQVLSFGLDATYVFNSLKDFSQNTLQLSASLRLQFNSN